MLVATRPAVVGPGRSNEDNQLVSNQKLPITRYGGMNL